MNFDLVLTNPPFQDTVNRNTTPHKLWIDFTEATFERFLRPGGLLCQVSPASFRSPSNRILELMKEHTTIRISFDTGDYFPEVGSTFADYLIEKTPNSGGLTEIAGKGQAFNVLLDDELFYLPNELGPEALSVHRKVIFHTKDKLDVERDYVTCHNINLKRSDTLSKTQTDRHVYPVFHTNRQTWWSSIRQDFASDFKVMWTRSGYTKPFFDPGRLGGTDMVYFVRVESEEQGHVLAHNMNLGIMKYIYKTAKWSGFGNEKVFEALPALPMDRQLTDDELCDYFKLTSEEVEHVRAVV